MKSIKSLVAALAAVTLVGAASAQTVVRITGSTAYRNATEDAVKLILSPGYVWGGVGKLIGGTQLIFSGTLATTGNAPVIILTSFTGSEGGIYNLYNPSTPPANATYIAHDAAHLALLTGAGYTGFTEAADATDLTAADIALADTFQNASPFGKAGSLVDTKVGIVAFSWFGAPNNDSITNITAHQAQAALSGQATYALWNNASADRDVKVHVVGRDPDSGTRDNTLLETGAGVLAAVQQFTGIGVAYTYNTSTSAFSAGYSGDTLYPAETVNGSSLAAGQGGFSSGGSVAALVADQTINAVDDIIGYIGTADSLPLLVPQAHTGNVLVPISWEGVAYASAGSTVFATAFNESAITSGQYTFWSYEHLFVTPATVSAAGVNYTVAQQIENLFLNTASASNPIVLENSGYKLSDIVNAGISKAVDGGPVVFSN